MVREKVQYFYGVGGGRCIEIHDATKNVTLRGTATEVHHDSDPHISTVCGELGTSCEQPTKLWLLWKASKSRRLVTCYSDTVAALRHLGLCGYLIQYSGESLMLPANLPHAAALSLSPQHLYSQTFHIKGRARESDYIQVGTQRFCEAIGSNGYGTCLLRGGTPRSKPRIRAIHINHIVHTISSEKIVPNQIPGELYISRVIGVLKANRKFNGMCGECRYLRLKLQPCMDCWTMHDSKDRSLTSVKKREHPHVERMRSPES
jgi:hypothetical protein